MRGQGRDWHGVVDRTCGTKFSMALVEWCNRSSLIRFHRSSATREVIAQHRSGGRAPRASMCTYEKPPIGGLHQARPGKTFLRASWGD